MHRSQSRWWLFALLVAAVTLCITPAAPAAPKAKALADVNGGFGPDNRPAFLVISLASEYDLPELGKVNGWLENNCDEMGSPVMLINVGTFIAGNTIEETRFEGFGPVDLELPMDEYGNPIDFIGNPATIIGAFKSTDPLDPTPFHLMTSTENLIGSAAQEAIFNASPFIEPALGVDLPQFPTTVELALFIYNNQGDAGADINDIQAAFFDHDDEINPPLFMSSPSTSIVEAEGALYPHDPDDGFFDFRIVLDLDNATATVDICLPVDVDIKPGSYPNSVNLGSEGVIPVAVLTDSTFATSELDRTTVRAVIFDSITGLEMYSVSAVKTAIEDVDDDGDYDLIAHFSTQALQDEILNETTVVIQFRANTSLHGMCVQGSDTVRLVPANNNK